MMEDAFPPAEFVHVLKQGQKLGPFTLDDLLDGLESGDFSEDDICLREGATDCERLRDVLEWEEDPSGEEIDEEEEADEQEEAEPPAAPPDRPRAVDPGLDRERLLYSGHPSVLTYPISLFGLVGGTTGGIWLYGLDPKFTLVGLGIAAAGLVRLSLVRFSHDYLIRPRRIETVVGLIARSSREVRIEDIRAINVTCHGVAGMFGIGTVDFFTSGDSPEVSFHRVWAANRIKSLVRKLQDAG